MKKMVTKPNSLDEDRDSEVYLFEYDLIGSAEYIAPEVLLGEEATEAVDYWALGCIIYLFFHGETPFNDKCQAVIFEKIRRCEYNLRSDLDPDSRDIIVKLLEIDPRKRMQNFNSYKVLKKQVHGFSYVELSFENNRDNVNNFNYNSGVRNHPFFKSINFGNLTNTKAPLDFNASLHEYYINKNSLLNDQSLFNSLNNISLNRFNSQNFNSTIEVNKDFISKNSKENIHLQSIERTSDLTHYTTNNSDSSYCVESTEEKFIIQRDPNLRHKSSYINGASPFKLNESLCSGSQEKISLESEIYSCNNSFLNFLEEERRKSKSRFEKYNKEKCEISIGKSKIIEPKEQQKVILEGNFSIKNIYLH